MTDEMSVVELKDRLDDGQSLAILDVREPWEREICAIAGSISIPLNQLPGGIERLAKDRPLVVLCHHGMRSRLAVDWLRANGVNDAVNLAGGIDAWARQVDRQMKVY
jgi:rhodanese-related sulfurtransferase